MRRAALLICLLAIAACAPAEEVEVPAEAQAPPATPGTTTPAGAPTPELAREPMAAEPGLPVRGDGPPLPAPNQLLTRIALGSCSEETRDLPILAAVMEARPDLFLMLGDNVYGDVRAGAAGADDPRLPKLGQAYADMAVNAQFSALNMGVPILATWDDHDFGLNDGGAEFAGRERAERLFESFWTTASLGGDHPGVYGARTFGPPGRRVQILMLDTRFFRSPLRKGEPNAAGRRPYVAQTDPAATMLGEAQWRWLEAALREPAEVRLLVSSIQVLSDNHPYEAWWTLPGEQRRLFDTVRRSGARGVVTLSGDRHVAALYRRSGVLPYPLHELTASSLNLNFVRDDSEMGSAQIGPVYTPANFGLVEIDWAGRALTLSVRGLGGSVERRLQIPFSDLGL